MGVCARTKSKSSDFYAFVKSLYKKYKQAQFNIQQQLKVYFFFTMDWFRKK